MIRDKLTALREEFIKERNKGSPDNSLIKEQPTQNESFELEDDCSLVKPEEKLILKQYFACKKVLPLVHLVFVSMNSILPKPKDKQKEKAKVEATNELKQLSLLETKIAVQS